MRVSARRFAAMLVAASMAAVSSQARAQSAQFASMTIWAQASTMFQLTDPSIDTWGNSLSPLSVNSLAVALDYDPILPAAPIGSVTAFGNGNAIWASAAKGSVSETLGVDFDNAIGGATFFQGGNTFPFILPNVPFDWEYRFLATNDGTFIMNADITAIPGVLGYVGSGWRVVLIGGPQGLQWGGGYHFSDPPVGTWSFTGQLTAGSVYTAALQSNAGWSTSIRQTFSGSGSGTFDWEMTGQTPVAPVPEPASYALVLTGLVAIGSVLRRRTRA